MIVSRLRDSITQTWFGPNWNRILKNFSIFNMKPNLVNECLGSQMYLLQYSKRSYGSQFLYKLGCSCKACPCLSRNFIMKHPLFLLLKKLSSNTILNNPFILSWTFQSITIQSYYHELSKHDLPNYSVNMISAISCYHLSAQHVLVICYVCRKRISRTA